MVCMYKPCHCYRIQPDNSYVESSCKNALCNVSAILQDSIQQTDAQMNCSATAKVDLTSLTGTYKPIIYICVCVNIIIILTEGEHNSDKDVVLIIKGIAFYVMLYNVQCTYLCT